MLNTLLHENLGIIDQLVGRLINQSLFLKKALQAIEFNETQFFNLTLMLKSLRFLTSHELRTILKYPYTLLREYIIGKLLS